MFITSEEGILFWGQTLVALEATAFHGGDEHFSAGNECVEIACLSFSHTHTHTHTHTASYQRLSSRIYVEMIAIVTATYL